MACYEVTRYVRKDGDVLAPEPYNHAPRSFSKGEIVYKFTGPTYGCLDADNEVAISEHGSLAYPFYGFPRDAVKDLA
jgi:hypothetical protein